MSGQLHHARSSIQWATEYLIKCHIRKEQFVGQVSLTAPCRTACGKDAATQSPAQLSLDKAMQLQPGHALTCQSCQDEQTLHNAPASCFRGTWISAGAHARSGHAAGPNPKP